MERREEARGRRSKERGWDGDGTETGRSLHKNASITVIEMVFYILNKLKLIS